MCSAHPATSTQSVGSLAGDPKTYPDESPDILAAQEGGFEPPLLPLTPRHTAEPCHRLAPLSRAPLRETSLIT